MPGIPRATRRSRTGDLLITKPFAVAQGIVVIAYQVLVDGQSYRDLGCDYFEHLDADRLTRYHTKRLGVLGYTVTLTKSAARAGPPAQFT